MSEAPSMDDLLQVLEELNAVMRLLEARGWVTHFGWSHDPVDGTKLNLSAARAPDE